MASSSSGPGCLVLNQKIAGSNPADATNFGANVRERETSSSVDRKVRRKRIAKATGGCDRCPPHGIENVGRRPRSDRHKTETKGR